ncbi:hypothetical protein [Oceaniglobus indicus]|uniref:hypothetical protein n=1 Tax=Oceaniglobus indicus TaxID=2047749 RepID=UPI0011AB7F8E|nr:hypothetical protein [Oceaniglobus indicus]
MAHAQSAPGNEDLRALRFYVQQNETSAINAEIRRLQTEFPGWTPPQDLSDLRTIATEPTDEIAEIYMRLGRGDIEGMRRVLQRTRARYPDWQMPADMARQIELAEGQAAFDAAVDTRDVSAAARAGKQVPELFRCDRVNNAWSLAELEAAAGRSARALATYEQIVKTCTNQSEIVATIEKAEAVTSDAELTRLTQTAARRFPASASTFEQLNQRLLAGRGRGAARTATAAMPAPVRQAAPARQPEPPRAAAQPAPAAPMAAPVRHAEPSPLQLPNSGDGRVARTRAAKEAGNFVQCLAASARPRSLDLAYERAWCAYNMDRPLEAMGYFTAAAEGGLGADVTRDARFGLALTLLNRNMTNDAAQIAAATNLTTKQRKEVEIIILDQRGVAAYERKEFPAAIRYLDALEQLQGGLRRDLAVMRAYAYLNSGKREEARAQFRALNDALETPETRAGLRAAS